MKTLAFLTGTCMLLGTYVLAVMRGRLSGVLEGWQRDPVDRWSPALPTPTSPK